MIMIVEVKMTMIVVRRVVMRGVIHIIMIVEMRVVMRM